MRIEIDICAVGPAEYDLAERLLSTLKELTENVKIKSKGSSSLSNSNHGSERFFSAEVPKLALPRKLLECTQEVAKPGSCATPSPQAVVAEALVLRAWTSNLVSLNVGGELKQPVTPLRKFIAQELPPAGVADRQNGIASFGDGLSQQLHAWSGHSCSPEDTDGDWRTVMTAVGSGRLSHDDEALSLSVRRILEHAQATQSQDQIVARLGPITKEVLLLPEFLKTRHCLIRLGVGSKDDALVRILKQALVLVLKDALTPYGEMLTVDRSELLPVAQSLVIALDMDIIAKPGFFHTLQHMLGNKGGGCQLTGLLLLECCPAFAPGLAKHLEETQETFGLLLNLLHKLNIDELNDYRDYVVNLLGWGSKRISGLPRVPIKGPAKDIKQQVADAPQQAMHVPVSISSSASSQSTSRGSSTEGSAHGASAVPTPASSRPAAVPAELGAHGIRCWPGYGEIRAHTSREEPSGIALCCIDTLKLSDSKVTAMLRIGGRTFFSTEAADFCVADATGQVIKRWKPDDLAAYSMQEVASDTPLILCARQDTQKENFELTLCNCPATQFDDIILAQASFPEYKYVKGLHVCGTYAAMGLMSKSSRQQHGVLFDIGQLDDQKHQLRFLGLKKGTCKWLHCFTSILGPDLQPNVLCAGGPGGILVYDLRSDKFEEEAFPFQPSSRKMQAAELSIDLPGVLVSSISASADGRRLLAATAKGDALLFDSRMLRPAMEAETIGISNRPLLDAQCFKAPFSASPSSHAKAALGGTEGMFVVDFSETRSTGVFRGTPHQQRAGFLQYSDVAWDPETECVIGLDCNHLDIYVM